MVLIFSDNDDGSTNEVIEWLNAFGTQWVRINESDLVALEKLIFKNNRITCFELKINDVVIDLTQCYSYWYRRGYLNWSCRPKDISSIVEHQIAQHLAAELKNLDDFVHQYLEATKIGINAYLKSVNNKTYYQFAAAQAGLDVPDSIITTRKKDVKAFGTSSAKVITKSINEGLVFFNNGYGAYSETAEIKAEDRCGLADTFFPSLVQKYVEKFAELRIFFIHDQVYAMAIFSQQNEQTKLDYRNYDRINPNRNVPFALPSDIKDKLIRFMNAIQLNCGSIDMILTPDNEYVFLEVNPIGQFGMVSGPCNYGLEKLIAHYLSYGTI
ncbi:MAG: grasp-with-spasm system ATP-grasp peptide maturase [Taibaiella sp.]|nr:grasp-with-spasm system ATP-grasp peptide maturase [Taibaiella sp.]